MTLSTFSKQALIAAFTIAITGATSPATKRTGCAEGPRKIVRCVRLAVLEKCRDGCANV